MSTTLSNAILASIWLYMLRPIASHQVLIFLPLYATNYPANAQVFCKMLLEAVAFEMLPADDINERIWGDTLDNYDDNDHEDSDDMGKFESLGFDGHYVLPNLTSTLTMLLVTIVANVFLLLTSFCYCFRAKKSKFIGRLFWNTPIRFLMDSYGVVAISCIFNFGHMSWHSNDKWQITINSVFACLLLTLLSLYPLLMVAWLYRRRN